jgi:hypothetical protein
MEDPGFRPRVIRKRAIGPVEGVCITCWEDLEFRVVLDTSVVEFLNREVLQLVPKILTGDYPLRYVFLAHIVLSDQGIPPHRPGVSPRRYNFLLLRRNLPHCH